MTQLTRKDLDELLEKQQVDIEKLFDARIANFISLCKGMADKRLPYKELIA